MKFKRAPGVLLAVLFILTALESIQAQITPMEAVAQMRRGINMGNTLEPPLEGDWNDPAEEVYFDHYKEAGFDVVRIPVRWDKHTETGSPYKVKDSWMNRVEEVADWGLSRGFFVVINSHHDNWIKDGYSDPLNRARFDSIWSQVATHFKDKPEKLIFEILNEPHGLTETQNNEMHQRVLNIIRLSNPTRNVILQGNGWGGSDDLIAMAIPEDDYIIGSFHSYDPWPFGLEGTGSFGSSSQLQTLENKFIKVKNWSDLTGIPIFLGEFACHKSADYNSRMRHYRAYTDFSQKYGFTPVTWDDGGNFGMLKRATGEWLETKDIVIYCDEGSPSISKMAVLEDTLISLEWSNGSGLHDSIWVQRKQGQKFQTITTLPPGTTSFVDGLADRNQAHYYRIIAHFPDLSVKYSHPLYIFLPAYIVRVKLPYLGAAQLIPGIIEAEDFDTGGEGLGYHETDNRNVAGAYRPDEAVDIYDINGEGYYIGNAMVGEWYEYTVNVEEEGDYRVDVHCSSIFGGGQFAITLGDAKSDTLVVANTNSWVVTDTTSCSLTLLAGEQILRFTIISDPLFNIDRYEFSQASSDPGTETGMSTYGGQEPVLYREVDGDLVISSGSEEPISHVQVYSLSGALVAEISHPALIHRVSTSPLGTGIYLVRTFSNESIYRQKVFIQ